MMEVYRKIEFFILRIIENLENRKITLTAWLVSFYAIYLFVALLESYSRGVDYFQLEGLGYVFVFFRRPAYLLLAVLFIILLLHLLTREKIEKISKIALFSFPIFLLPSIIDLLVAGQGGITMESFHFQLAEYPAGFLDLVQFFFYGVFYSEQGILFLGELPSYYENETLIWEINYGARIRYGFIFLGFIWYSFLKTKSIFRVFLGIVSAYFYIFVLLVLFPWLGELWSVPRLSSSLNPAFGLWHNIFTYYFLVVCLLAVFWFYFYSKEKFLCFLKSLRIGKIAANLAFLSLGLYFGGLSTFDLNSSDIRLIVLAIISLLLYGFSKNGISSSSEEFRGLGNVFQAVFYITAYLVGYAFFIFILLRGAVDYLYRSSPFRLKQLPVLAPFCRALAFLLVIYAGFLLIAENTIFDFPGNLALFFLAIVTLGITAKDIKTAKWKSFSFKKLNQ